MTGTDDRTHATPADDDPFRTRPGTPMHGPFSTAQMDDFYSALAVGQVKPTGVMNLLQRLIVAAGCRAGDRVVDVCCGRGLQLPVLRRYCPGLAGYTGLDVSADNLAEVTPGTAPEPFPVALHVADVSAPWPVTGPFDVAVYTSALEHLPREHGAASLRRTAEALVDGGRLFLSTPNTPGDPPRRLQHRVHVYEWSHAELVEVLDGAGFEVTDVIGILPPDGPDRVAAEVRRRYGDGGAALYAAMQRRCPPALLGPVLSTGLGPAASEVLYTCTRRPR